MIHILIFILSVASGISSAFAADVAATPPAAKVFFVEPKDGATVSSPVKLKFGLEGMQIGKLGDLAQGTGHHHLVIDDKPVNKGEVVPTDDKHVHFGKGQTETDLELLPGDHTLTLQFADGAHRSYGSEMSSTIKVKVVNSKTAPAASKK
jgi:hypothetical protein